ncbi:hypothetical protein E2562_028628, partial [Oryza meyeriana var. granulata]
HTARWRGAGSSGNNGEDPARRRGAGSYGDDPAGCVDSARAAGDGGDQAQGFEQADT